MIAVHCTTLKDPFLFSHITTDRLDVKEEEKDSTKLPVMSFTSHLSVSSHITPVIASFVYVLLVPSFDKHQG